MRAIVAASLLGLAAAAGPATSEPGKPDPQDADRDTEYRVKAAFVYNFIRYTTWPEQAFADRGAPIVVEVVGEDPFGKHLAAALEDKVVRGRRIVLLTSRTVPDRIASHLVFEGDLSTKERKKLLGACEERPVLLCGERDGFAELGAQCNFYLHKGKVRFEVNIDSVESSDLDISSELLKLARIVRTVRR